MERVTDQGAAGMAIEHLHTEKFSDNSEAELDYIGLVAIERGKRIQNRKRKRGSQTDVSTSSSLSSGAASPLNLPWSLGYIGKIGFDSGDEHSDGSRSRSSRTRSVCGLPGYHSATTAVITDSEDDFPINVAVADFDTFSVEYEPPETNSEDENDDDDSDEEEIIIIPSSSEDEDPGAEGGDEYDLDSDSEDSWECPECWTMNHPMTVKCLMCWKERTSWVQQLNSDCRLVDSSSVTISSTTEMETACVATCTVTDAAKSATNLLLERNLSISLSRSSSSCSASSTQTSCDSGVCVSSCETDNELHKQITETTNINSSCRTSSSTCAQKTKTNGLDIAHENTVDLTQNEETITTTKDNSLQKEHNSMQKEDNSMQKETSTQSENKDASLQKEGTSMQEENTAQKEGTSNLCVVCSTEPRNASIIHGRSGHQVCCMTCAEKLKADKKRCPVCRKKIQLVIKNFL